MNNEWGVKRRMNEGQISAMSLSSIGIYFFYCKIKCNNYLSFYSSFVPTNRRILAGWIKK